MKKMEKAEKRENLPGNNTKDECQIQFFSDVKSPFQYFNVYVLVGSNLFYLPGKSNEHLLSVFHPPSLQNQFPFLT